MAHGREESMKRPSDRRNRHERTRPDRVRRLVPIEVLLLLLALEPEPRPAHLARAGFGAVLDVFQGFVEGFFD